MACPTVTITSPYVKLSCYFFHFLIANPLEVKEVRHLGKVFSTLLCTKIEKYFLRIITIHFYYFRTIKWKCITDVLCSALYSTTTMNKNRHALSSMQERESGKASLKM